MGRHSAATQRSAGKPGLLRRGVLMLLSLAMIGGGIAFVALAKSVTVVVNGTPQVVSTYAADVEGVLDDAQVRTSSRDAITPGLDATVHDGTRVNVITARQIDVSVDGVTTRMWVTALTVDEALAQLGMSDHAVSVSRDSRLPADGGTLEASAPKTVTVTVDGATTTVTSAGPTVDDVLQDLGVQRDAGDLVDPAPQTELGDGMAISVTRVAVQSVTQQRTIPFTTVEQPDPNQYVGINTITSTGVDGVQDVVVEQTFHDGVLVSSAEVSTQTVLAPVDHVVSKGAKAFPASVDALNWAALGKCESTNNPLAVSPSGTYHGEYQFSVATWHSVGGQGIPTDAPAEEQLARAKILFMKAGAGQWACGHWLYS